MNKNEAKSRDLHDYPKEVLVEYLRTHCLVRFETLDQIKIDLAYKAADRKLQQLQAEWAKVDIRKRPDLYYKLRRQIYVQETRTDRLFKRIMKSLEG